MKGSIFQVEFRDDLIKYLVEAGIDENEAQKIVRKRYRQAIKQGAIEILRKVIKTIKDDNCEGLRDLMNFSPGGDGMGIDNHYIDFKDIGLDDVGDVYEVLKFEFPNLEE